MKRISRVIAAVCAAAAIGIAGAGAAPKISSTNCRVVPEGDYLGVFSNENRPVSSGDLISAISASGYTFKYVSPKPAQTSTNDVHGGYVLAKSSDGEYYIPIMPRGKTVKKIDFTDGTGGPYIHNPNNIPTSLVRGVGGRSDEDKSFVFAPDGSTGAGSSGTYLQYGNPFNVDSVYTVEFSVYNNSDAAVGAKMKHFYTENKSTKEAHLDFLKYMPDGSVSALNLNSSGQNVDVTSDRTFETGKWHRVALTVDPVRSRCTTYMDGYPVGELWTPLGSSYSPQIDYFQLKMLNPSGAQTVSGEMAFDDLEIYRGYYDSREQITATSDALYIDDDVSLIYGAVGRTAADAAGLVSVSGGGTLRAASADGAFRGDGDRVAVSDRLWLCDADGNVRKAYRAAGDDYISDVRLYQDDKKTGAELTICPASQDKPMKAALAAAVYDDGTLVSVSISGSGEYSGKVELSAKLDNSAYTTKIFLLDGFDTMKPRDLPYRIGSKTLANIDFESDEMSQMVIYRNGNTFERMDENDENGVYHLKSVNTGGANLALQGIYTDTDYAIYELDVKMLSGTGFSIYQKESDSSTVYQVLAEYRKKVLTFKSGESTTLGNEWHRLSFASDYRTRYINIYFDGRSMGRVKMENGFAADGKRAEVFRLATDPNCEYDMYIDNFRAYEGLSLRDDIGDRVKQIDLSITRSVFESDEPQRSALSGYMTLHTRSGVVYDGTNKTILENKPAVDADGSVTVDASELSAALGLEPTGKSGYITLDEWAELSGKTLTSVDAEYNSGLVVIGNGAFSAPSDTSALNAFAFSLRPTPEQIAAAYRASDKYRQHPRIMANQSDFDRIIDEYESNSGMKNLRKIILEDADWLLDMPVQEYKIDKSSELLGTARSMAGKINTLAMAYRLTGETKYAERTWAEIKSAADFPDWYPQGHLCPAEMAYAVATGYDWIYDALTDEQRGIIEEAMYEKLLYPAWEAYLSTGSAMTNGVVSGNNHTIICNSGIAIGAMAVMDRYPKECAYLVSNAIRGIEGEIYKFAHEGAWYEGASYWEYAMSYSVKMLSALQTTFGTDFGLAMTEGLREAADFLIYMMPPRLGLYNYSDATPGSIWAPELLWLANEYDKPHIAAAFEKLASAPGATHTVSDPVDGYFYGGFALEDKVLRFLWSKADTEASVDMPLDRLYKDEGAVALRDGWSVYPTYVGIHGGMPNVTHGHLDAGSFIFDSGYRRWSRDPGMGNYSSEGYFDDGVNGMRWKHFHTRAEAHSTLVINPGSGPDHAVDSYAEVKLAAQSDKAAIVTVDMSDALRENVIAATRGFFFTDNRKSLVVRDEIDLSKDNSEIYWFMMSSSDVRIESQTDSGCVLNYSGYRMKLDYVTDADSAELTLGAAEPLPTSPVMSDDPSTDSMKRLALKLTGSGKVNITVKLTPYNLSGASAVAYYDKPISEWSID